MSGPDRKVLLEMRVPERIFYRPEKLIGYRHIRRFDEEVEYIRSDVHRQEILESTAEAVQKVMEAVDKAKKELVTWRPISEYTEEMGYVDIFVRHWGRAVNYRLDIEDGYPDTWFPENDDESPVLNSEVTHFMEIPEGPK